MLSGDWVAGFCDGEAWFSIQIASSNTRLGFGAAPIFRIEVAKADESILHSIRDALGVGRVIEHKGHRWGNNRYEVCSLPECLKIRDFFLAHPLHTKKRLAFKVWAKALDLISSKRHLNKEGFLELAKLRDKINPGNKRQWIGKSAYRDYNYFKQLFDNGTIQLTL